MLGSKKSGFGVSGGTTLISLDTVIVGDVHFSGNLDIEGLVQGNVVAVAEKDAMVRVVNKGRVEGEIRAPSVVVNGSVKGDIHSSRQLELASRGRVDGNVHYTLLEMAAGAEVNGSLTHVGEGEVEVGGAGTGPAVEVVAAAEPGPKPVASVRGD